MKKEQRDTRFLRPGEFAGLKFAGGWWFVQVIGAEYVEVKPWTGKDSDGNREALDPGESGQEKQEITDSGDNRVLEPSDNHRNTINQILYGVSPSRMQVFSSFGRDRTLSAGDYDEPGDPAAYLSGSDTPYDDPSKDSEVFYVNSMAPLRLQPFNPMSEAHKAVFSFHLNKLRYTTVTNKSLMKAFLQGQRRCRLHMMGLGVQNSNQVELPNWLEEAFGSHIYQTQGILDADSSGGQDGTDRVTESAASLSGRGQ